MTFYLNAYSNNLNKGGIHVRTRTHTQESRKLSPQTVQQAAGLHSREATPLKSSSLVGRSRVSSHTTVVDECLLKILTLQCKLRRLQLYRKPSCTLPKLNSAASSQSTACLAPRRTRLLRHRQRWLRVQMARKVTVRTTTTTI